MKNIFFFLIFPSIVNSQLSESLLNKVRISTDDYYISHDTLDITCSKTLPCLEVMINGFGPYNFLVDLGSNVLLIERSVVDETNCQVLIARERNDIIKASKLQIGNSVFLNVYGAAYENLGVDGVIGYNLLSKSNFFLDYPKMSFAFISEDAQTQDSSYTRIETLGRMPYIKSSIEGKQYFVNFDTGADLWLYFPLYLKDSITFKSPIEKFKNMHNNQTGTTMTYIGQIESDVQIGNYLIKEPFVIFDPNIDEMYLGSSLLSEFNLIFYPKQKLIKMEREIQDFRIYIPRDQKKKEINITIKTKKKSQREIKAKKQLERIIKKYGSKINKWYFTSEILINESARIPHSHPTLTINCNYLDEDLKQLSTFLHEQFHWLEEQRPDDSKNAINTFQMLYPEIPADPKLIARDRYSTYLHFIICDLEYQAMTILIGKDKAKDLLLDWNHYTWIYEQVINNPEVRKINQQLGFTLQ